MDIWSGLKKHYSILGIRGVLAISAFHLFGRPQELIVRAPGIRFPVNIRLHTTDLAIYDSILFGKEYFFDLPIPPKTIIDAGANIGMASIYFAHAYPEARIIAIEPEPSNFRQLVRNVAPYKSIVPVQAALWNRDGEISIGKPDPATGAKGEWSFVTREGAAEGEIVRAITIGTLLEENGFSTADLVKVDIEGAEQELFSDTQWLTKIRYLMIELHDHLRPGCAQAVEPSMTGFTRSQRNETIFYRRVD